MLKLNIKHSLEYTILYYSNTVTILNKIIKYVILSSKGAIPVNYTSVSDLQMAVRPGNVISITLRQV